MKVFLNIEASEKELKRVAAALLSLSPENGIVAEVEPPTVADDSVAGDISGGKKTTRGRKKAAEAPAAAAPAAPAAPEKTAKQMLEESEARQRAELLDTTPAAAPAKVPSSAEVRAAAEAYANKKGFPAARAIVQQFGVERVADIPEAKRVEFLAAVKLD